MSKLRAVFLIIFFSSYSLIYSNFDKDKQNSDDDVLNRLKLIANTVNSQTIKGGIAVYTGLEEKSYFIGINDFKDFNVNTQIVIEEDLSSLITASILYLFEKNKLNIESFLTSLIPNTTEPYISNSDEYNIPFKSEITLRMLLQNRSGIYEISHPNNKPQAATSLTINNYAFLSDFLFINSADSLFNYISNNSLYTIDPGANFSFSKTGYLLLAKSIERATQSPLINFIKENFENINPIINIDSLSDNKTAFSTIARLAYWNKSLFSGKAGIDKKTILHYMCTTSPTQNPSLDYGMGCFFVNNLGYGNIGLTNQHITFNIYDPNTDFFVLLTINNQNLSFLDYENSSIIDELIITARKIKSVLLK